MTKLRLLRMQAGLSQRGLAEMLEVHQVTVDRIEGGWLTRPPKGVDQKLSEVFGDEWTWEALMEDVPKPTPDGLL